MNIKPFGYVAAIALAASSLQAGLFVGPDTGTTASATGAGAALIFKVVSTIEITSVSAYADGGSLGSSVPVEVRDFNNTLLGGATVTGSSPVINSVWATEAITPIFLAPGTYSISGMGGYTFDFGSVTHATYNGGGAVTAYDTYYGGVGASSSQVINGGTPALPNFGANWVALGDPKMRAVNFDFTAVPEPSTYALVGGLALVGFGLFRRQVSK